MKIPLMILGLILISCMGVLAQAIPSGPGPTPEPERRSTNLPQDRETTITTEYSQDLLAIKNYSRTFYRKPTEEELAAIRPSAEMMAKYAAFLTQPHTGLTRLAADNGCDQEALVVNAANDCFKFTIPGGGNSYSFRRESYCIRRLADITLSGDKFLIDGVLTNGMLVNLGAVPVEKVNTATPGMKYLVGFQPATDPEIEKKSVKSLADGVEADGFLYARSIKIAENVTYALRSVAYRGVVPRSIPGAYFNELDYDKRADVVVIFRVVERSDDGSITILWNELSRKDAPKLKQRK